jgi:hypothetical protein
MMVMSTFAIPRAARSGAWKRFLLRWGMLLTLIEPDAGDWAKQEALRWLEAERRESADRHSSSSV